ncbi:hypothetical protein ACFQPG_12075 [Sphingomonas sp. GCM10030256]|uniref:hypothetical protein n=1 Tax=Sphingomonas sp. GCM10030256 TaxID=3273427 RepID=UPI00361418A2
MPEFRITELAGERIEEAFALVRLGTSLSRSEWRDLTARLSAQLGGVLGISAGGVMLGLAGYCIEDRAEEGRWLRVDPFIVFELSSSAPVRTTLVDELRAVADRLDSDFLAINAVRRGLLDAYSAASGASSTQSTVAQLPVEGSSMRSSPSPMSK